MKVAFRVLRKDRTLAAPAPAMDGAFSRQFWATRESDNTDWVDGYWASRTKPLRQMTACTVAALDGSRVLEVGAHCGVNLWAIGQKRPFEWLVGVDISAHVVERGQRLLAANLSVPHALHLGSGEDLPFPDHSFDIVLSAGTLVCIGPERIERTLREMLRVARRFIVLVEPLDESEETASAAGREDPYPNTMYWIRNYRRMIESMAPGSRRRSLQRVDPTAARGHLNSIEVIEIVNSQV
jgi:hypothetical protein